MNEKALAALLSAKIRDGSRDIAQRWLERISARVTISRHVIFPSKELLDHIPVLIDGIADYVADSADEVAADMPVIAKAIELGNLRHAQGFEASQILKEYEILGGIIFEFVISETPETDGPSNAHAGLVCANRLFRAIAIIQQVTADQFLRAAAEAVRDREQQLRGFNGAVSHEVKNRLGLLLGAVEMLQEEFVQKNLTQVQTYAVMISENVRALNSVVDDLIALSRVDAAAGRQARNVALPDAIAEAVRQLREFAAARNVAVRIASDLPDIEVPASLIELCVANYLSNAIKYHNPEREDRVVDIRGHMKSGPESPILVLEVVDNGLGVPEEARGSLFKRFFRAHKGVSNEQGSGLGLSIVRDVVESVGGTAWGSFDAEAGTVFGFEIPCPPPETVATPFGDDALAQAIAATEN